MKVGIIGIGNMGGAIAKGLINSNNFNNNNLYLYNRTEQKLDKYKSLDVNICIDTEELLTQVQVIILAIKPKDYKKWLKEYSFIIKDKLFISIAAGISSSFLEQYTNLFILTMPNMGSQLQKGYTVICNNNIVEANLNEVIVEEASKIFREIGKIQIIEENQIEDYIGLIGSSPAYFMELVKMMSEYFIDKGYDKKEIEQTLAYIMETSALVIQNNKDKDVNNLVNSICSSGGATIEAINNMQNSDIKKEINNSIDKCIERAIQMKND